MSTAEKKRKNLSHNDVKAAQNLRKIWTNYTENNPGETQATVAKKMGWTQGNFSLYLNQHVAIGPKALKVLCAFFGVKPWQIRRELEDTDSTSTLEASISKLDALIAKGAVPQGEDLEEMRQIVDRGRQILAQHNIGTERRVSA